ncbi:MAG: glycerol-3-phosphate 1-O-acyltransferase PlsY [Alphaproteobacteria bacterium]|nr:glycerol-3-phosphate 1-O-acyltransferase PlsY [Alphaproteobacteria bacterium]
MENLLFFSDSLAVIVLVAMACGYFFGAIPFGLFVTQFMVGKDLRRMGSGNIGATNVLRTGSKAAAALTLLFDMAKGTIPSFIFLQISPAPLALDLALIAGFSAVLGHVFPCWLGFKGGKGVATVFGVVLLLQPEISLIIIGLWLSAAAVLRYSSVSSIIALFALPIIAIQLSYGVSTVVVFMALAALIISRHHDNITRLIKGSETTIALFDPSSRTHSHNGFHTTTQTTPSSNADHAYRFDDIPSETPQPNAPRTVEQTDSLSEGTPNLRDAQRYVPLPNEFQQNHPATADIPTPQQPAETPPRQPSYLTPQDDPAPHSFRRIPNLNAD